MNGIATRFHSRDARNDSIQMTGLNDERVTLNSLSP
jgi:hypothetical protein